MIVELANTISSQDQKIEMSTCQRMVFPAPAIRGKTISLHNRGKGRRQRTFAMNPQKRTCFGALPFQVSVASEEPRGSPRVAQFAGSLVIYGWIWR
jgi:hypothetical protein